MSQHEPWCLDGNAEELYERYLVPAKFDPWAADLVALSAPQPGERVLDVACGTGVVTCLIGQHVGAAGQVVGLDLNAGRLAITLSMSSVSEVAMEWREGDVSALPFSDAIFDLVCCQQGFQFFPDRLAALREMSRCWFRGDGWRSVSSAPLRTNGYPGHGRGVCQCQPDFGVQTTCARFGYLF